MKPQIWLGIIVVILFWLFFMKVFQSAEKSVLIHENFVVPANTLQDGQQRFNDLTNLINLTNPQVDLNSSNQNLVTQATNTPNFNLPATGGLPGSFVQSSVTSPYMIPSGRPDTIRIANDICEKVKTSDCTAFQNPEFAKFCGISFDLNGINSKGEKHIGGLFISSDDRDEQVKQAKRMGLSENDVRFTPSIGSAKKGLFVIDAGSCKVVSEQIACKNKKVFESPDAPNCTQCFTSGEFNRVNPATPRVPPRFIIQTNADYMQVIVPEVRSNSPPIQKDTPMTLPMQIKEGEVIFFDISGNPASTYFCGYLSGDTINGPFNMDLKQLIDLDTITNYKPRLGGSKIINDVRCITIRPGTGKNRMNLRMLLPFSFLSSNDYDAGTCENGPIISKKSGADYLQSDVCYGKGNKPGSYSLDCLQQMFVSMGGTTEGKGYPSDAQKANAIMFQNGRPLEMNEIANYLYDMNVRASTGKDSQGKSLSIQEWSDASVFITGQTISSPCDTPMKDTGPLSQECLEYLYYNKGATNSRVGPTYTIGPGYASRDKDGNAIYCRPEGTANPSRPEMFKELSKVGYNTSVVKSIFNWINNVANDNTLSNEQRKDAIKKCYGDNLRKATTEVFWVGPGYDYTREQANEVCKRYGANVATYAEVDMAQKSGADWCATGWIADGPNINTNVYMYGPWISSQNKLTQVRKLNDGTNVYMIEDDVYTKMVSENREEKYYRGTINQFNPSNWNSYTRTPGNVYLLKKDDSGTNTSIPYYPITTRTFGGCGNGSPGMKAYLPPNNKAGVNCVGPKPEKGTPKASGILPFNEKQWNAPS